MILPPRLLLGFSTALAVAYHASEQAPLTTAALEALYRLPPRKLEPVVRALTRASILASIRGAKGGYYLPHPDIVTLADVARAIIPGDSPSPLLPPLGNIILPYAVNGVDTMLTFWEETTLAQLVMQAKEEGLPSHPIPILEYVI